MTSRQRQFIQLTRQALLDLQNIYDESVLRWGEHVAEKYLDELQQGLDQLRENSDLLEQVNDLHEFLRFYRVNKHLIVCDTHKQSVVVLTVIHTARDIPARLSELVPGLRNEIDLLHRRFREPSADQI